MADRDVDFRQIVDSLPYLAPDSPQECPVAIDEVLARVRPETIRDESLQAGDLEFVRTARLVERRYWLWRFYDEGEIEWFVSVSVGPNDQAEIGFDDNFVEYSPEEYIVSDYLGVF